MMNSIMGYIYTLVFFAIFVAVLEMILPKGNNKKYVRLVSGIILTYITISPIISILSNVSDTKDNIEQGIETFNSQYSSNKKVIGQEQYILNLFEKGVQNDIKNRVEQCGYVANNVEIKYNLNDKNEITDVTYIGFNVVERIENVNNENKISKVDIKVSIDGTNDNDAKSIKLNNEEIKNIKTPICEMYQISEDKVHII